MSVATSYVYPAALPITGLDGYTALVEALASGFEMDRIDDTEWEDEDGLFNLHNVGPGTLYLEFRLEPGGPDVAALYSRVVQSGDFALPSLRLTLSNLVSPVGSGWPATIDIVADGLPNQFPADVNARLAQVCPLFPAVGTSSYPAIIAADPTLDLLGSIDIVTSMVSYKSSTFQPLATAEDVDGFVVAFFDEAYPILVEHDPQVLARILAGTATQADIEAWNRHLLNLANRILQQAQLEQAQRQAYLEFANRRPPTAPLAMSTGARELLRPPLQPSQVLNGVEVAARNNSIPQEVRVALTPAARRRIIVAIQPSPPARDVNVLDNSQPNTARGRAAAAAAYNYRIVGAYWQPTAAFAMEGNARVIVSLYADIFDEDGDVSSTATLATRQFTAAMVPSHETMSDIGPILTFLDRNIIQPSAENANNRWVRGGLVRASVLTGGSPVVSPYVPNSLLMVVYELE